LSHQELDLLLGEALYADDFGAKDPSPAEKRRQAENWFVEAAFTAASLKGARTCLDALRLLEFDTYARRRFCADGEQPDPVIHALRGSMQNVLTLGRERANEEALTLRLNTLITEHYGQFRF
jgi:hypothetical protein